MALTKKKITVRGKSGKTFQRSVMVRAGEAVKRTAGKVAKFVGKHKGKIAGAAALAGAAYLGARHGGQIAGAAKGLHSAISGHMAERREAKASGRSMAKGSLGNAVRRQVSAGRDSGREADNARMSSAKSRAGAAAFRGAGAIDRAGAAVHGAASSAVTRAVSGVAGLHAAVSNRRARKAKAS